MATIKSNSITFVDITDSRKLDVYISSNLPTTQIYDSNAGTYSPDWSTTNLKLTADIYLDSEKITPTSIKWYTKINTSESQVGNSSILTINTNALSANPIITYICRATYENLQSFTEITFMRTDTGKNGTSVTILGSYNTLMELQSAHPIGNPGDSYIVDGDLYVWTADDAQWQNVGNIQGPKGDQGESAKAIILNANAQVFKVDKTGVVSPSTITVTAQTFNTDASNWTYSINGGQTFLSTVPTGVSRSENTVTITGASLASNSIVIKASDSTYSDTLTIYKVFDGSDGTKGNDGAPAPIAFLTNENVTFGANEKGQITSMAFTTNVVAYSGITKVTPTIGTITGLPTGMTVSSPTTLGNELILTFTITNNATLGSELSNNGTITIPITSPVNTNLKLSWSKVNSGATGATGAGVKSTTVTYGVSDSASTQPDDDTWQSTIPVVAEGKYLWTRTIIDYTDDTIADTVAYTYAKQGTKGDAGTSGSSVTISSIQYQEGTSATNAPTGTWSNSVVAVPEGGYLWTRTVFSDSKVAYGVAKQGVTGAAGKGISSIVEQYYQSTSATAQSGGSWSATVPTWVDGKYIWTRSVITYTDSTTHTTSPVCVTGQKGGTGGTGVGVSAVDVWYYQSSSATSLNGGSWSTTAPTWVDGKYVWTKTITTYTDATTDETSAVCITGQKGIQGPKGNDGVGISSTTVTYGVSDSSSTQPTSWQATIPTVAEGKYLWTRTVIDYTDEAKADTVSYTYTKQGTKGDQGSAGSSVTVTSIQYQEGTSATTAPTGTWSNSVVSVADGKYLWTKTVFSDGKTAYGVAKQGSSGRGVKSVTEYYLATASSSGVTTSTSGWTTTIQTITIDKKYLWNYEVITYTDDTTNPTTPIIIGVFGNTGATGSTGATGKGIKSVTEYYLATASSSGITTSTTGWTTTMQSLTSTNKYLWNYELITYTDDTISTINPVIIGVYGDKGNTGDKGSDAYTVILTNESHVFAGNVSSAIAATATTQVLAYKGSAAQSVTIVSVDGKTASTSSTATSITGLSFSCSALSGTSPTITFTCTTSFVSPSGTIPIVLKVDGVTITKMFTYGIAFKGSTGAQGSTGTAASLVDITPSAHYFKSTTGKDGTFTPEYIYLYPRFQTVTFSKWEYSVNGGTTWVAASGANGLTISTYNSVANTLRIARTSTLYTDAVTSISFRCVSSNTSVYDTVSIAKIYDVVDLEIGGANLLLNTSAEYRELNTPQYVGIFTVLPYSDLLNKGLKIGDSITFSVYVKSTSGKKLRARLEHFNSEDDRKSTTGSQYIENAEGFVTVTTVLESGYTSIRVMLDANLTANTITSTTLEQYKLAKLEKGNKVTSWSPAPEDLKTTTFQIYAPKGYVLTNSMPELTLEAFAYDGSQPITNATFKWSSWDEDAWVDISGVTGTSLTVNKNSVFKSGVYQCEMTYQNKVYTATATVDDKTDLYSSLIQVITKYSPTNKLYWVLYSAVYSEEGERDKLLGPISVTVPTSPTTGQYWYKIDETNYTVTLMKYSGTAWATTTDKQELVYDWSMLNDTDKLTSLGSQSKVKIITSSDFSKTCTVQCNIRGSESIPISYSNQILNDPSDPIVSATEPSNPIHGQLWIKLGTNGLYTLLVWDSSLEQWIVSETDSRVKVHMSKPTSYAEGDVWVVGSDYEPVAYVDGIIQTTTVNGVTQNVKHLTGTMLKAQYPSTSYKDSDWIEALKYKNEIDDLKENLNTYNQFFSADEDGLVMQAKDKNGVISEFKTKLTHTELGFYQGENKVAYINNNQLNISKAEITNGMTISGAAPVLEIGNFIIIQESNGSLSIGSKI